MSFKIGDKVLLDGLRSPRMIVVGEKESDGERMLECMWFSKDMIAQRGDFREAVLVSGGSIRIRAAMGESKPRLVYVNPDKDRGIRMDDNGDILF